MNLTPESGEGLGERFCHPGLDPGSVQSLHIKRRPCAGRDPALLTQESSFFFQVKKYPSVSQARQLP